MDKCEIIHGDVHDKNILLNNKRFTVGGLRRGLLADLGDGVKVGFEGLMVSKGLKSVSSLLHHAFKADKLPVPCLLHGVRSADVREISPA